MWTLSTRDESHFHSIFVRSPLFVCSIRLIKLSGSLLSSVEFVYLSRISWSITFRFRLHRDHFERNHPIQLSLFSRRSSARSPVTASPRSLSFPVPVLSLSLFLPNTHYRPKATFALLPKVHASSLRQSPSIAHLFIDSLLFEPSSASCLCINSFILIVIRSGSITKILYPFVFMHFILISSRIN